MSPNYTNSMNCKTPVRRCRRRLLPCEKPVTCVQNTAPVTRDVDELLRAPRRQHPHQSLSHGAMDGLVRRLFSQGEPSIRNRNSGAVTPENHNIGVDHVKVVRAPRREPNQRPIESLDVTPVNLMKQFVHC